MDQLKGGSTPLIFPNWKGGKNEAIKILKRQERVEIILLFFYYQGNNLIECKQKLADELYRYSSSILSKQVD